MPPRNPCTSSAQLPRAIREPESPAGLLSRDRPNQNRALHTKRPAGLGAGRQLLGNRQPRIASTAATVTHNARPLAGIDRLMTASEPRTRIYNLARYEGREALTRWTDYVELL
jgi:hypothetical protein